MWARCPLFCAATCSNCRQRNNFRYKNWPSSGQAVKRTCVHRSRSRSGSRFAALLPTLECRGEEEKTKPKRKCYTHTHAHKHTHMRSLIIASHLRLSHRQVFSLPLSPSPVPVDAVATKSPVCDSAATAAAATAAMRFQRSLLLSQLLAKSKGQHLAF